MRHLFLDAQVFLDFFRYGSDDISEIGKLTALLRDGEINLHTNTHLRTEVDRMREGILSKSFAELKATRYSIRPPNYCRRLEELEDLNAKLREANAAHGALVTAAETLISDRKLEADILIAEIIRKADNMTIDPSIIEAARLRRDLGNPPGKQKSLGDAINWECLLRMGRGTSIDIVSRDGDFESELNPNTLKSFLDTEWKSKKGPRSKAVLFKSLGEYFRKRYPDIKVSDEVKKTDLIEQLRTSPNFATTHSIIGELSAFKYFTQSQVVKLFEILIENSQVSRIATDDDLHEFYLGLKDDAWLIPDHLHDEVASILGVDETDFFIPF